MQTCVKYFEKEFKANQSKKAYLKVCKWLAQNIISKKELCESMWTISKVEENLDYTIFKLELFCALDDNAIAESFCEMCKGLHKAFFINEEYNCNRCNMITFRKRLKESLDVKRTYRDRKVTFNLEKK